VGYNYYGALISQCYFTGTVLSNKSSDYVGGIAGYNSQSTGHNSRIEDCWSSGTVSGGGNAGGIVGQNQVNTYIRRCYSTAVITAVTGATGVGCITGMNASAETNGITGCAALNPSITNSGTAANAKARTHRVAGLAGSAGVLSNNIAWSGMILENSDGAVTPTSDAAGADGADCAQKPAQSVFTDMGWDFAAVWKMGSNGYPALKWQ
jgi:hypothetical protein